MRRARDSLLQHPVRDLKTYPTLVRQRRYARMATLYPLVMGREAMIATEHYLSAAAGARMFARGGNAIDAAVAATLVEGVVNPHMHTIGGEAPMLIYVASARRVIAINGNMTAPARATNEHYRRLGLEVGPPV